MAEVSIETGQEVSSRNGHDALENRLRSLFAEQRLLREQLERTREQLDQVNAEVLRFQEEYCKDAEREEQYSRCLQKVLGFDTQEVPALVEEARASGQTMDQLLEELEQMTAASRDVR